MPDDPRYTFTPPQRPRAFWAYVRSSLNALGTAGCAVATLGHSFFRAPFDLEFVELPMPMPGLPRAFDGFRILHVTDFHTNRGTPVWYLRRALEQAARMPYDLAVITGDFVTHRLEHVDAAVEVAALLRGPVLGIFGNHDYADNWETWSNEVVARPLAEKLAARGIRILRNEAVPIERDGQRLWIVGMEDWWTERFSTQEAFRTVPRGEPVIALTHNADSVFALEQAGAQWVLAGHTHGGQIRLPFLESIMVPQKHKHFDMGLFEVGRCKLYVSRGIGFRRRARFRCRPEITVFTLKSQ